MADFKLVVDLSDDAGGDRRASIEVEGSGEQIAESTLLRLVHGAVDAAHRSLDGGGSEAVEKLEAEVCALAADMVKEQMALDKRLDTVSRRCDVMGAPVGEEALRAAEGQCDWIRERVAEVEHERVWAEADSWSRTSVHAEMAMREIEDGMIGPLLRVSAATGRAESWDDNYARERWRRVKVEHGRLAEPIAGLEVGQPINWPVLGRGREMRCILAVNARGVLHWFTTLEWENVDCAVASEGDIGE